MTNKENKMTKDIEAAKKARVNFVKQIIHDNTENGCGTPQKYLTGVKDGWDGAIEYMSQALNSQSVDVEGLIAYLTEMANNARDNGYGETVGVIQSIQDHLQENGYLKTPEPKTERRAQTDFVEKEVANTALHKCVSKRAEPKTEVDIDLITENAFNLIEGDIFGIDSENGFNSELNKKIKTSIRVSLENGFSPKPAPDNSLQVIEGLDDAIGLQNEINANLRTYVEFDYASKFIGAVNNLTKAARLHAVLQKWLHDEENK